MYSWKLIKRVVDWFLDKPKIYSAIISQSGSAVAPTVTVLENTIGEVAWSRYSTGRYRATLTGAFTLGKTAVLLVDNNSPATGETNDPNDSDVKVFINTNLNENYIEVRKGFYDSSEGLTYYSDGFGSVYFEIRVYL